MARTKIYTTLLLTSFVDGYVAQLKYPTKILWKNVVNWVHEEYPGQYDTLSIAHFSRVSELKDMRDRLNENIDRLFTDANSSETIVQDISLDVRDFQNIDQNRLLRLIADKNTKICKLIDSFQSCKCELLSTRKERNMLRKQCEEYKKELSSLSESYEALHKEYLESGRIQKQLRSENKELIRTNATINGNLALRMHCDEGYCYQSVSSSEEQGFSTASNILSESEARVLELIRGSKNGQENK